MNSTVRKGEECFFILKKYGGIVVSYTKKVEGNRIQKNYIFITQSTSTYSAVIRPCCIIK